MKNGFALNLYYLLKILNKDVQGKTIIMNGIVWLARSGAPWRDLPERYGSWKTVHSRFRKWIDDGILDNIFRILSLSKQNWKNYPLMLLLSRRTKHMPVQKKGGLNEIGHSREERPKIHAAVDAHGYPVYLMIARRQRYQLCNPFARSN